MTPTATLASVLSALLAKNSELWLWSTGVAQAASRSGAGTEQLQASRRYCKKKTDGAVLEVINRLQKGRSFLC